MGMIKCEYCDCPISTTAHKCPNCGGIVTVSEGKQRNTYVNVEKKQEESMIKGLFEGIGLIIRKILKYILISLFTFTVIFFIIFIVVMIKAGNGDFDSYKNATSIESEN